MRRSFSIVGLLLCWLATAVAQGPGDKQPSVEMAPLGSVRLSAGGSTNVDIAFRVSAGFHINSNKPRSEFLIPTELKLAATPQVAVFKVNYPAGQDETFPFSPGEKLSVYSGDFTITAELKAPSKARPGTYPVKGELTYQACDKAACYPPKTMPVQFQVLIVAK